MSGVAVVAILLILGGLAGAAFGVYAMLRGGRSGNDSEGGGIGPIPERGVHLLAGARMLMFGVITIAAGVYALVYIA